MSPRATILIPTHDHGPTLRFSVASALAQTVQDLEVLVVGDGVPDETREIMAEFGKEDDRVRFFDNPKGPRHGEIHRHAALEQASGEVVCYLSDDDLFLPEHVETMQELLAEADFAHTLAVRVLPDETLSSWPGDLSQPFFRDFLLRGINFLPLSSGGHTMDAYRRLPRGWHTTPPEIGTDLSFWQQLLRLPGCRTRSSSRPTVLHLASSDRVKVPPRRRAEELGRWYERVSDPAWRAGLPEVLLDHVVRDRATHLQHLEETRYLVEGFRRHAQGLERHAREVEERSRERLDELEERIAELERERTGLGEEIAWLRDLVRAREREMETLRGTATWRLRQRLVGLPGLARLSRWAARARAGPGAR